MSYYTRWSHLHNGLKFAEKLEFEPKKKKKSFWHMWNKSKEKGWGTFHWTSQPWTSRYDQTSHSSSSQLQPSIAEFALWEVCFRELNVFLLARLLLLKSWDRCLWWAKMMLNSNPILSCLPTSPTPTHPVEKLSTFFPVQLETGIAFW